MAEGRVVVLHLPIDQHQQKKCMTKSSHQRAPLRISIIGLGAIGRKILRSIQERYPDVQIQIVNRSGASIEAVGVSVASSVLDVLEWKPHIAVECAGQPAVEQFGPPLLRSGIDFMVASVGALGAKDLCDSLQRATGDGGSQLLRVSGAIGGLDALEAAHLAGLNQVRYIGRKPPLAWMGTPGEQVTDLDGLREATLIFQGNARSAAQLYPKNANVTAAVALAGMGFDETEVQLFADPTVNQNVHELHVKGSFGEFEIRLCNAPLPENPKTSWLAALSIEAAIHRYIDTRLWFTRHG